jgi:hypothetical protein
MLQIHHYNLLRPEAEKETASSQHVTKIIREDTLNSIIQKITPSYLLYRGIESYLFSLVTRG